jgi:uncharacterized protein (TIGR02421 family)
MNFHQLKELSARLKEIAKDLSFLGHPRYPLRQLVKFFPQHHGFIQELEDLDVPFKVDVSAKRKEMELFLQDLEKSELEHWVKEIFIRRTEDYQTLLSMMGNFHSPFFYEQCTKLYGTSHKSTQNNSFLYFLEQIPQYCINDEASEYISGDKALNYLRQKVWQAFPDADIEIKASTSLLSDSSAGRRVLKLNINKDYTTQQLDIFLVHEGWVHLGTSLNGAAQEQHPWLSTWAPRTTFLQEGLAILTELITGTMTKERWSKVILRHLATSMAERGSNIQDVYSYLRHQGMDDLDSFKLALRVFRGVPLEGGMAFTKELLYLHGLIQLLYHLRFYQADLKSLWLGKQSFEEHTHLLSRWRGPELVLKYFPIGLEDPLVQKRLEALKDLAYSLFNRGFL